MSKDVLNWKLVKGKFEGPATGKNPYVASKIGNGLVYLSWKEESGYQFFNLMDFNTGTLTTHADVGDKNLSINMGKVTIKY